FDDQERGLVPPENEIPPQETILSLAKGPFTQNPTLSRFRAQMAGFSVYHEFHTHRDAAVRQPTVTRYEKRVDADGQNLISVLHTLYTGDRDFKNEVNDAMTAAFGSDFEELVFPPAADQRIQLRVRWRSLRREQSAADLSDGTLRFLFLLTVLASPDPAPVIAIDEPETGLHPSMLPIVAEYAVQASRRAQIILTTRSPQLLDAFSETRPTTTVVKCEEGETCLFQLDDAKLAGWLEEYSLGSLQRSGELEDMAS
ncbi:MAG: chromosome segregation protein SMC, partial [Verrucomicrobiaceae bacterium]